MSTYQFTLFIAGQSPRSTRAVENLRGLTTASFAGDFELVIVDVMEDPEQAEAQQIMATPTLVKSLPEPARRVTGDLSDLDSVARALGLPR